MIRELIEETNGKIFSVEFVKKDGSLRKMVCRLGVTKYLKNGKNSNTNPNHIFVWDLQKKGYRTINLETVKTFKCGKFYTKYEVWDLSGNFYGYMWATDNPYDNLEELPVSIDEIEIV